MKILMRYLYLIILLGSISSGLCNNIIGGAYPGEFYTNSFYWVEDNTISYGIAYSPDCGRTLELTSTGLSALLNAELLSIASPGLCYLHYYDQINGNELVLVQGFGQYFTVSALYFGFFEIIQSGFTLNQVFMIDFDQDTLTSTLYRSEQSGYESYVVCTFDSIKVTSIERGINTGEIYLTSYDFRDNLMHILHSTDMGLSFTDYPLPIEIQLPGPVISSQYKIYPQSNGILYIGKNMPYAFPKAYKLYRYDTWTQETSLIWERDLQTNEYLFLVPVFSNGIDFIVQKLLYCMSRWQLVFFESSDEGTTLVQTGSYLLDATYTNPTYLVPVPADNPIPANSTSSNIHVRSNVEWSVATESDWILNISPTQGDGHTELTLSFGINNTGVDRSAALNFHSDTAQDTILVIIQSGDVPCSDELNPALSIPYLSCYPNPTKHTATLRYHLTEKCYASIDVYNLKGQMVRSLTDGIKAPGTFEVKWDGRDDQGIPVSSGVYIVRLKTPGRSISSKLLLLKQ
ncbi:MAG: FlgD immunoglobulin-like domain containing protein [Candidatus Cloacimonadaceae bacterium]|jgi:hypothetical protein